MHEILTGRILSDGGGLKETLSGVWRLEVKGKLIAEGGAFISRSSASGK